MPQAEWHLPHVPRIDRHAREMQAVAISLHAGESQLIPGRPSPLHHPLIDGAERICNGSPAVRTEPLHQLLARAAPFSSDLFAGEPGETAMCRPVRGKVKAARS